MRDHEALRVRGLRGRGRAAIPALLLSLLAVGLTAPPSPAALGPDDIVLETKPELYPSFRPGVDRYVTRCRGERTRVTVDAGPGVSARIDGRRRQSGRFSRRIPLDPGAAVTVLVRKGEEHRRYRVRCLPEDFPEWSFQRFARPGPQWKLTAVGGYAVIFDRNGVPTWWLTRPKGVNDAKLMPGGGIAWWTNGTQGPFGVDSEAVYQIVGLDGSIKRRVKAVGANTDFHDMQPLPNGNLLVVAYGARTGVDLSDYGGPADAAVFDGVIQEVDRDGELVWEWNSKDHIGLEETGRWWGSLKPSASALPIWDIVHINSVEPAGSDLIASFRHTDAVYSIDRATGEINWKLGGTETAESLEVAGDSVGGYPVGPFGGQHDARLTEAGNLTVFDNGTDPECGSAPFGRCERPPRAVEFEIDEDAGIATLVGSVDDPRVRSSNFAGGARKTAGGGWVITWGSARRSTGFAPDGSIAWRYEFSGDGVRGVYRTIPIEQGALSPRALRRGMDRLHPHDNSVKDPRVRARRTQRQSGSRIALKLKARAGERVRIRARGYVRALGKRYSLARVERRARADRPRKLKLRLRRRASKRLFKLLDAGRRVEGRAFVRLTDPTGNTTSRRLGVRLR